MEVDVDVASSSAANTVVKLVQGATRHLVVDMAILLEVRFCSILQNCWHIHGPPCGDEIAGVVATLSLHA